MRADGAHTHGHSSRFDWRVALVVVIAGLCMTAGGRSFLFGGLTEALLWIGAGLAACAAVLGVIVWRVMRRSSADYARMAELRAEIAATRAARYQVETAWMHPYSRMVSWDDGIRPDYVQYGTITGRLIVPEPVPQPLTWPQRRDLPEIDPPYRLNPGHEG